MTTAADSERMKSLLLADIADQQERASILRDELSELRARIRLGRELFCRKYPDESQLLPRLRRHRQTASWASRAAAALTEESKVNVPLSPAEIHRAMIRAGAGTYQRPTRPVLISGLFRSPLFCHPTRGKHILLRAVDTPPVAAGEEA